MVPATSKAYELCRSEPPMHFPGAPMRRFLLLFTTLFLVANFTFAGPQPQSGTILSHTSVACGSKKSKKKDIDLLCQQYVVRSGATDYTIRQQKPADEELIPLNTTVEFKLDKSKMKFKANGKSYEYMVVGQAAATLTTTPAATPAIATPNPQ